MKNLPRTALLSASPQSRLALAAALRRTFPGLICDADSATPLESASLAQAFDLRLLLQDAAGDAVREISARQIRTELIASGLPFSCLYGSAAEALGQAEAAIRQYAAQAQESQNAKAPKRHAWHWNCENCSDSDCEHRLFSALRAPGP